VCSLRVSNLGLQILNVLGNVVSVTRKVRPLQIRVQVDLDDTVGNGCPEVLNARAGATVENEENRLGILLFGIELLRNILLMLG
jgi:hypothetical protein